MYNTFCKNRRHVIYGKKLSLWIKYLHEIKFAKCEYPKVYYNLLYFFTQNFSNNNIEKHRRARLLCPILIGLSLVPRSFYRKKPIDQSLPPTPEKTAKNLITLTFNHISHFFLLFKQKIEDKNNWSKLQSVPNVVGQRQKGY